jgi:hypothetical protein
MECLRPCITRTSLVRHAAHVNVMHAHTVDSAMHCMFYVQLATTCHCRFRAKTELALIQTSIICACPLVGDRGRKTPKEPKIL